MVVLVEPAAGFRRSTVHERDLAGTGFEDDNRLEVLLCRRQRSFVAGGDRVRAVRDDVAMVLHTSAGSSGRRTRRWPEDPQATGLFIARAPLRQMVVMIDAHLTYPELPGPAGLGTAVVDIAAEKRRHLAMLLRHQLIDFHLYADEGPPPGTISDSRSTSILVYPGWVYVLNPLPAAARLTSSGSAVHATEDGWSLSGFMGNAADIALGDTRTGAYADMDTVEAALQRRRDVVAAQVADQALKADLFVTARPYLLATKLGVTREAVVCSVEEALALVGLYLRTQGEYLLDDHSRYGRGLYFWVAARALLPAGWRWFSACVQHSSGGGDLIGLGESALRRVTRALMVRDSVHVRLCRPQDHDVAEEGLADLDEVCVLLMGALDAAARVAHRALGLSPGGEFGAGWQKTKSGGWLDQVGAVEPDLQARVATGTDGQYVLTVLRLLRNTVHGAALRSLQSQSSGKPSETLVIVPDGERAEIKTALEALGGAEGWGGRTLAGALVFEPGVVVDRLCQAVIPLLDDVMRLTPVERLAHVVLGPEDYLPLADDSVFDAVRSARILWQLGLRPA